jgi:hypothetical protein
MKTTLNKWNNAPLSLRPVDVAQAYARIHLPNNTSASRAVHLFEDGDARGAKRVVRENTPEFGDAEAYLLWAQFSALFLKSSLKGDTLRRKQAAEQSFQASERRCKRTNRRLRWYGARTDRENPLYRVLISRARGLISQVLGNFTERTLEQIIFDARPGPGVTIGTQSRDRTSLPFKLGPETVLAHTPRAKVYARMLIETSNPWVAMHANVDWIARKVAIPYREIEGNRVAFVPKDATTDRTIAVEPHLNVCLQLGVDAWIRRRLKSVGVDLDDQSLNQRGALSGSLAWAEVDPLATLDLASASDSISCGLVERLIPTVWREFLDEIRSDRYKTEDGYVEFQKWSSMGNGYTFALESLIFWGLAKACTTLTSSKGEVLIYGDDICLRRGNAAILIELLEYVGFRINTDKSFVFGPFRESCGSDYWEGKRVTPCYLRGMATLRPTDCYRLLNRMPGSGLDGVIFRALRGRSLHFGLPSRNDSGVIWSSDMTMLIKHKHIRWHRDWQSWEQREFGFKPKAQRIPHYQAYVSALFGARKIPTDDFAARTSLSGRGLWAPIRTVVG